MLAGKNAANAARGFLEEHYRNRDIEAALYWSQVMEAAEILLLALPLLEQPAARGRSRPKAAARRDGAENSNLSKEAPRSDPPLEQSRTSEGPPAHPATEAESSLAA